MICLVFILHILNSFALVARMYQVAVIQGKKSSAVFEPVISEQWKKKVDNCLR